MNQKILGGVAAVLFITLLVLVVVNRGELMRDLPPKEIVADLQEAGRESALYAFKIGGRQMNVLGTGSERPYIPAAKPGQDPLKTIVAFVVIAGKYEDVKVGKLCCYEYEPNRLFLHHAAKYDGGGWIMSGLNNRWSETDRRMTEKNFRGIVQKTWILKEFVE